MSTYYLLVSAGGDTLSVDGTTILAYQAGSVEGPGGSFTLTPVFDTALISLPSEVEVWYSTDNVTFSRTAGIAGATWVNNVLSGTVGSSTTVYAKLYYSTGTPVTDENGTGLPLAAVSATVGGIGSTLTPGPETPSTWSSFSYTVNGDGQGLDLSGDSSDPLIGDAKPAARFLTPLYNDNTDITEVALVTHPTSYYKNDGTQQADPLVYFYCNGNRILGTKTVSGYGSQEVWKVLVSGLSGQCEFRAVVIPEKGTPTILQGGWSWNGTRYVLDTTARGCMSNDYTTVSVGPAQTYNTLIDAFAAQSAGNGAIRYVCSGQGVGWSDAFSTTDVMCDQLPQNIANNPMYEVWPIVDGAKLKMAYNTTTSTRGLIWNNCEIYNWPNPATTYTNRFDVGHEEYWYRNNNASTPWRCNNHDLYIGTINCTVAIKENTTYTRPGGNSSAAQVHVDRGFGTLMHLYDLGKGGNQVGFNHTNVGVPNMTVTHHGTSFRFMGSNCDEAINTISVCPSADNDIFNSSLVVNTFAHTANKFAYPFGSLLADQTGIGYNYDYSQATSDATYDAGIVSTGTTDMQNRVNFTSTTTPGTPPPYLTKDTIDAGIWPDMLFTKWRYGGDSTANNVDLTVIFEQSDGTYMDYYGYTYATWPFLWNVAQDPHLDFVQNFSQAPKNIVIGNSGLLGWEDNLDYQGIFYRYTTVQEAGAWFNLQFTSGPQVKYSVGMENATSPGPMIFGPGLETLGEPITSLRDFVTASNTRVQVHKNFVGSVSEAAMDPYTDLGVTDSGNIISTGTTSRGGTVSIIAIDRPPVTIGSVSITGSTAPDTGSPTTYTAAFTGTAEDAAYSWSTVPATSSIVNNGNTADITFNADGTYVVSCEVSSGTAIDTPVSGSLGSIVATTPPPGDWFANEIGAGTISTISTSAQTITFDAAYPSEGAVPSQLRVVAAVNGQDTDKNPIGPFTAESTANTWPNYVGVYIPAAITGGGFQQNHQEGWYVFDGATFDAGFSSRSWQGAKAWPTIVTSGSANDRGFLETGSSTGSGIWVCFWNVLPPGLGTGAGATDSWSNPNT